jgi:hypothetical protein
MFGPRARPVRWEDLPGYLDQCAGAARQMKILRIPYYQVWRAPSKAIAAIRIELVASGKYPALASLQKEGEP